MAPRRNWLVHEIASGAKTKPEQLGHREFFIMYKHQDTPSLEAGCRHAGTTVWIAGGIGWAAVYLCSPAASFINGVLLPVDGGASIGF